MIDRVVFFIALLSAATALGGALAHALELPNKIGMPRDDYFVVQRIYRGWSRLGFLLAVEVISILALIILFWPDPVICWAAICAMLSLLAAQFVFWTYAFPADAATGNWTRIPPNWKLLRRQWEFSHAAGAGLQLLAVSALIVAALSA